MIIDFVADIRTGKKAIMMIYMGEYKHTMFNDHFNFVIVFFRNTVLELPHLFRFPMRSQWNPFPVAYSLSIIFSISFDVVADTSICNTVTGIWDRPLRVLVCECIFNNLFDLVADNHSMGRTSPSPRKWVILSMMFNTSSNYWVCHGLAVSQSRYYYYGTDPLGYVSIYSITILTLLSLIYIQ